MEIGDLFGSSGDVGKVSNDMVNVYVENLIQEDVSVLAMVPI